MLISILIAAYNIENYIEECLNSCINQTYKEIEIIVVNDGSTDGTKQKVEYYATLDKRVKIINKENGGLVSARKVGVETAIGDYIFFLDGDDNIPFTAIESLTKFVDEKTEMVVANYNIIYFGRDNKIRSFGFKNGNGLDLINCIFLNSLCNIWGNLYKKSLFEKIVFPEHLYKSIGEDLVTIVQLAYYTNRKILYVDHQSYNYFVRQTSIIGRAKKQSIWALGFGAFITTTKFIFDNGIEEKVKQGYLKLLGTYVIGYLVSSVKIKIYKNELQSSICYANANWNEFKLNQSLLNQIVMKLAFYNIYLARFIGRLILLIRHLF